MEDAHDENIVAIEFGANDEVLAKACFDGKVPSGPPSPVGPLEVPGPAVMRWSKESNYTNAISGESE
jgi:hypothetical protein